jgi:hypothetical protein
LTVDESSNLIVVDANLLNPLIYVFSKTGEVLSAETYQPVIKNLASNMAFPNLAKTLNPFDRTKIRFTYCKNNYLYASDLGRSIVYKTTLAGEILCAFGKFGKHKGEFNEPSGLYVDKNGAILVGDSKNDRLQVPFFLFLIRRYVFERNSEIHTVFLLRFMMSKASTNVM